MRAVQICNRQGSFLRNRKAVRSWKGVRLWNQASLSSNPLLSFISCVWKSTSRTSGCFWVRISIQLWSSDQFQTDISTQTSCLPLKAEWLAHIPLPRHLHIPEDKVGTLKCRPCQQGITSPAEETQPAMGIANDIDKILFGAFGILGNTKALWGRAWCLGLWSLGWLALVTYRRLADWGQFQVLSQRSGHSFSLSEAFGGDF